MRGRIGFSHVVFGIDKPAPEEVFPVTIDQGLGEEGVVFGGHPADEFEPRIHKRTQSCRFAAKPGRFYIFAGFDVFRFGVARFVENKIFAWPGSRRPPHAREERREAVIIALAPFLEGMMVTLGALEANAEEELGGVFHLLVELVDLAIPGNRRVVRNVAGSGQNGADKIIVGQILPHAFANPIVEGVGASFFGVARSFVAQQGAPFVGEQRAVARVFKEGVNPLGALVRLVAAEEFFGFPACRQTPGDVQRRPADEGGVICNLGGRQADGFKFAKGELVDEVIWSWQLADGSAQRHACAKDGDLSLITNHHGDFAWLFAEMKEAVFGDFRHFFDVRLKKSASGNVFPTAVGIVGDNRQLLVASHFHEPLLGEDFDRLDDWVAGISVRHALLNPAPNQVVVRRTFFQPLAAAVRKLGNRLAQQKAVVRRGGKKPPPARFQNEMFVVFRRFKAEQGKTKSILSAGFAVATASVAANFGKDGNDLIGEVDGALFFKTGDFDLNPRLQAARKGGGQSGCAIGEWLKPAGSIHLHNAGRIGMVVYPAGKILGDTRSKFARDQQLPTIVGAQ